MTLILGRPRPSKTLVRLVEARVSAGFPSPADDYAETYLSLDELVNVRAPSVYCSGLLIPDTDLGENPRRERG
ncbi:hypothetical protein ACEOUA_28450, partial [Pseudomonas aeruginosa]